MRTETRLKARDIIGLGPIYQEDVEKHMDGNRDYEKAKKKAVDNYLMTELAYEEWELEEVDIMSTKIAKNDIIYVVVKEHDAIKEPYSRKAELKKDDLIFVMYIPPQYFTRFTALSAICAVKRKTILN